MQPNPANSSGSAAAGRLRYERVAFRAWGCSAWRCGAVPADTGPAEAWANYKLRCSDWYIDLLANSTRTADWNDSQESR